MKSTRTFAAVALALTGIALLAASPAGAARKYETQITPINEAQSITFLPNDEPWIVAADGIFRYGAFPSSTSRVGNVDLLASGVNGSISADIAYDEATHELYFADANGRSVYIFDESGMLLRSWHTINGSSGYEGIFVAVDNSQGPSRGRIYLSLASPEDYVEVVDPQQRPIDFPAKASYIEGSKLTGTPSGPFSQVSGVAVDKQGNLFVVDAGAHVVDEFDSTGTYLRAFPDPNARYYFFNRGEGGIGVDPTTGDLLVENSFSVKEYDPFGNYLDELPEEPSGPIAPTGAARVNSQGYVYLPAAGHSFSNYEKVVDIYSPRAPAPTLTYEPVASPSTTAGVLRAKVDPNGAGPIVSCSFEYGTDSTYGAGSIPCSPGAPYATPAGVSAEITGLSTETTYHYRVVVTNASGTTYGADQTFAPHHIVGLTTEPATAVGESEATLNGSLVGDGSDTHYFFEWGETAAYGNTTPAPPGDDLPSPSGPGATPLTAGLTGLTPYTTYHYRVVASSGAGTSDGGDRLFTTTPGVPTDRDVSASGVHSDHAMLHAAIDPNGASTTYVVQYVDESEYEASGFANAATVAGPDEGIGSSKEFRPASALATGLTPGTVYYYRFLAENAAGSGGSVRTFKTFTPPTGEERCPNIHMRQQTGSAELLDCRAYEEVSAANSDGYDVESSLVPGQHPFEGYGEAEDPVRVLYGVHDGGLPGVGDPTNRGVDPYIATRTDQGWRTTYAGIPADGTPSAKPFSSTLLEADSTLDTLAFGGPEICSPCFGDGSTGIPVNGPDGQLTQGMVGSEEPASPPEAAGFVGKSLSADGSHLLFGSSAKLEPDGAEGGISIYDRNLRTNETHVVSKTPAGGNLPCVVNCATDGIGVLDVSSDGSRVVVGQLISESGGARLWHLYMDTGDSSKTVDLTPGATHGVLYDGMTSDGSEVFFTTVDALTTATDQDTDHSADLYGAQVSDEGTVTLSRISVGPGGAGNEDGCDPATNVVGGQVRAHWNTTGSSEDCSVVAVGGGGGVAADSGTIYFLSPENLTNLASCGIPCSEKAPVSNAPNLYAASIGSPPRFVASLDSSLTGAVRTRHPFRRYFGAFAEAEFVAVDNSGGPSNGDVYVADPTTGWVWKYDPSGNRVTSWGNKGKLTGAPPYKVRFGPFTGLQVDKNGNLYVFDEGTQETGPASVSEFKQDGTLFKQLELQSGHLARNPGAGVDAAGYMYTVTEGFSQFQIRKYDSNGQFLGFVTPSIAMTALTVDSAAGIVYTDRPGGGINYYKFNGADEVIEPGGKTCELSFEFERGCHPSGFFATRLEGIEGLAVDPVTHELYVDLGESIVQLTPTGESVGNPIGEGNLQHSLGLAVSSSHEVYATNGVGVQVASFGAEEISADPGVDNPLVIDSVSTPGIRDTADFQVAPNGRYAAFPSTLPLTGEDSGGHQEVFRYDGEDESLGCPSCNPTGEAATTDSSLPANGLGLSADGRVFFNAGEGLVDRDLNGREDAYQWEPQGFEAPSGGPTCLLPEGCVDLISAGAGSFGSSILSTDESGRDAYFFTRDKLVEQDENGNTVKIYDAREDGGFPFAPPLTQCKASDECHGRGSTEPGPPEINTFANKPGGNATSVHCKRGYVKRQERCVRKHKKRHHKRHRRKRGGHHHG